MKKPIFILQQDQTDCGVACLLSILKYYGGDDTLDNLRRLSGTNIQGTTLLGLKQAATSLGFDSDGCQADIEALIKHQQPCILHVITEQNSQHYIVCYGIARSGQVVGKDQSLKFLICDPAKCMMEVSQSELERIWQSKSCLVLTPNVHFRKDNAIKLERKRWIIELLKKDFPLLSIAAALGIAISILGLVMALFSQRLVDDILPKRNFGKFNLGIALVFLLLLMREWLSFLRQFFLLNQSKLFNIRIIDFFYRHLVRLPKPFFDSRKIGEFTARLSDTARIQRVISQIAGNFVIDVFIILGTLGFLFNYSWQIAISCILTLPFYFGIIYWHNKRITGGQRNVMRSYAITESNYISTLLGIDYIKSYNKQNLFAEKNRQIYENFQDSIVFLGQVQIRLSFIANCFGVLFLIFIMTISGYKVFSNNLKAGELIAILGLCSSLLPSVANIAMISIPMNEAKVALERMFEFTNSIPEETCDETKILSFSTMEISHVSFRFIGRKQILRNVSFRVSKGEIIAIMGENGCGKSTLSQLLQKNYEVETGKIIVNSHTPLNKISFSEWRKIIGVVPQSTYIFNGSVLDNIAFDEAITNQENVIAFLENYGFMRFIEILPQSYLTLVGEEGINLSGGQKQLIAIARALYHKPQLLILDEATSAMDRKTERFVLELLVKLRSEMGIIFVTHRLHILRTLCARIYLLADGNIVNFGTHDNLMKTRNLYSEYWNDLQL